MPVKNAKSDLFVIWKIIVFCLSSAENLQRTVEENHGCRGYGDSHGDSHGYGYGMGMGTVMNPHGPVGILWEFLNECEIKQKRVKYAINVIVDV